MNSSCKCAHFILSNRSTIQGYSRATGIHLALGSNTLFLTVPTHMNDALDKLITFLIFLWLRGCKTCEHQKLLHGMVLMVAGRFDICDLFDVVTFRLETIAWIIFTFINPTNTLSFYANNFFFNFILFLLIMLSFLTKCNV